MGCDSVISYSLTVHWNGRTDLYDTVCANALPYIWNGISFDTTVTYHGAGTPTTYQIEMALTAADGADSTVTMHLTVMPTFNHDILDTICSNQSLAFGDTVLAGSNGATTYSYHTTSSAGCDSITTLHLTVLNYVETTRYDTLCQNQQLTVGDTILYGSDGGSSFSYHTASSVGCDSIVTIHLTVHPTYELLTYDTLCDGQSRTWYDTVCTATGSYPHLFLTEHRCDSVQTLILTVAPTYAVDDVREVCDSLFWHDSLYTQSGTAVWATTSIVGCDSVATLHLTVHPSYYHETIDTFCFTGSYTWRGNTIDSSTPMDSRTLLLTDTLLSSAGCDSTLALRLTRLPLPPLSIESYRDCYLQHYRVSVTTDAPYWRWESLPPDPAAEGLESISEIRVAPDTTTTYYVTADYGAAPRCPITDSITLSPIVVPQAEMKVIPEAITTYDAEVNAYDIGAGEDLRTWYINWQQQGEEGPHLYYHTLDPRDSLVVALSLYNGQCYDTVTKVIPVLLVPIYAPNAFTPTQETNNRFIIQATGIISAELDIYNREGLLVYHSDDLSLGWDGRDLHGNLSPQGSYVWQLHYRSIRYPNSYSKQVGTVLLIR